MHADAVVKAVMIGLLLASVWTWGIIFSHALRNSLLPVITVAGDLATSLVNGAVVVESVFGWPGIGKLMIDAIIQRDFAVVQSTVLVTACAIFILNIAIDILYAVLDPRIRYQTS